MLEYLFKDLSGILRIGRGAVEDIFLFYVIKIHGGFDASLFALLARKK